MKNNKAFYRSALANVTGVVDTALSAANAGAERAITIAVIG